jgi:hypothetical protein
MIAEGLLSGMPTLLLLNAIAVDYNKHCVLLRAYMTLGGTFSLL